MYKTIASVLTLKQGSLTDGPRARFYQTLISHVMVNKHNFYISIKLYKKKKKTFLDLVLAVVGFNDV